MVFAFAGPFFRKHVRMFPAGMAGRKSFRIQTSDPAERGRKGQKTDAEPGIRGPAPVVSPETCAYCRTLAISDSRLLAVV